MSSPTVLFVVKSLLSIIKKNDKGKIMLVMAFGPGLTIETVLLRVV
jgi:predicted naringenin-chalcone synthase